MGMIVWLQTRHDLTADLEITLTDGGGRYCKVIDGRWTTKHDCEQGIPESDPAELSTTCCVVGCRVSKPEE